MGINDQIWDRGEADRSASYLKEMLLHPANKYAALGALTTAALVSIPFGLGLGAVPLVAFVAAESIGALFIPSSGRFRAWVDRKYRRVRREHAREHLLNELRTRVGEHGKSWEAYARMRDRLASLEEVAQNRRTALTDYDVERLDDSTVSYLGLWLALLLIEERKRAIDDVQVAKSLAEIESQIESAPSSVERRRFETARDDLVRIQRRREGLVSQEAAVRARLLSMVDTFEEVYQQVVTDPTSTEASEHLQNAVERLQIEERLEGGIDEELVALFRGRRAALARGEDAALRQRQKQADRGQQSNRQ
ncbi:MAG: hypothetical protein IPK13_27740 [Deltaproteobacteria bacterium]|nr:hypothetical protein [Deltaproteobacteria bacterium]MBK8015125.1 hypothetical protein [Deltaproteobacteria bacterium]